MGLSEQLDKEIKKALGSLQELFGGEPEQLHADLEGYYFDDGKVPCLKHPLLYICPFLKDIESKRANLLYAVKVTRTERCLRDKDWFAYVVLHEKPYRLDAFRSIADLIEDDAIYWYLAREIWIVIENVWQQNKEWKKILSTKKRGDPRQFMTEEDLKVWDNLPEEITIYRGHQGINKKGFSWTLSKEKARWFAKRFEQKTQLVETKAVKKEDCFAYTNARGEEEIIIFNP